MLRAGGGAGFRDAGFVVSLSQFCGLSFSLSFSPSAGGPDFSGLCDVCDCLSQVESDEAFGVDERSSSLGKVDVEAVPKLGDDGVEVRTCTGAVASRCGEGDVALERGRSEGCSLETDPFVNSSPNEFPSGVSASILVASSTAGTGVDSVAD